MSPPTPEALMLHLRDHGVTVHHAGFDHKGRIAVFLEAGLRQQERAQALARRYRGVRRAEIEDPNVAILHVTVAR